MRARPAPHPGGHHPTADRLRRFQCAAPHEDPQPREEPLLLGREQVVAPVDCPAQGLVAHWQVARSTGERLEALREPRQQRLRWEQLDPRGGEFKRERQPVEASTDRSRWPGPFALVT